MINKKIKNYDKSIGKKKYKTPKFRYTKVTIDF